MVISEDVERKIDKDNRLLGYFNDSKPSDYLPREVVIAFAPVTDPNAAEALVARINGLLGSDIDFRMQPQKGAAVFSNIRASVMATVIEQDFVTAAGVGKMYRDKPSAGPEKDGRY